MAARRAIVAACVGYLLVLGLLTLALRAAAPASSGQAIAGVTIGTLAARDDLVHLSGRRFACAPAQRGGLPGSRCTVTIAGETLEVRGFRNPPSHPNQLGGSCEARYAGVERPCSFTFRHLGVPFFANVAASLDLDAGQRSALRREYFFENLGERPFILATFAIPPLTALVVASGVLAGCWDRARRRSLVAGAAIIAGLATLPFAFIGAFVATRGFWD